MSLQLPKAGSTSDQSDGANPPSPLDGPKGSMCRLMLAGSHSSANEDKAVNGEAWGAYPAALSGYVPTVIPRDSSPLCIAMVPGFPQCAYQTRHEDRGVRVLQFAGTAATGRAVFIEPVAASSLARVQDTFAVLDGTDPHCRMTWVVTPIRSGLTGSLCTLYGTREASPASRNTRSKTRRSTRRNERTRDLTGLSYMAFAYTAYDNMTSREPANLSAVSSLGPGTERFVADQY